MDVLIGELQPLAISIITATGPRENRHMSSRPLCKFIMPSLITLGLATSEC